MSTPQIMGVSQRAAKHHHLPPHAFASLQNPPPEPKPLLVSEIIVGEIIGWRAWMVKDGYLRSVARDAMWPPGEPLTGKVDSDEHGGGVYAFKDKRKLFDFMVTNGVEFVYGSVALWGDIVEHELGYRAENALIKTIEGSFPARAIKDDRLNELREIYRVHA